MDQQIKLAILLGFLSALFIVAILLEQDKYKLWRAKRKRRRLNKKRSKLNNNGKDSKPVWPIIIFFIMLVGIPTGLFFFYKLIIMKVVSEVKEIKGFEKIPNWFWLVIAILVIASALWYFRKIFSFKIPDTSKIMTSVKSWISWGNVLSILLIIGLGVFVYYQVTKPEEPGPNQTGWIPVKSSNSEITDISSYKELKIGETDSFEANVWKKFKFSTSNTKEQKYLNFYLSKSSKDTITLTFKQVSNGREWSWKHWIDKQGDSQCTLHSGELIAFKGDCLVKVDKGCSFNCLIK